MPFLMPKVELVMRDETGSQAAISLHALTGSTVAEIETALLGVVSILLSLSSCTLVEQRITYKFENDPYPAVTPGSDVKRQGIFILENIGLNAGAGPSPTGPGSIPGFFVNTVSATAAQALLCTPGEGS